MCAGVAALLACAVMRAGAVLGVLLGIGPAFAGDPDPQLQPEALRQFARDVTKDLKRIRKQTLTELPPVAVITKKEYRETYIATTLDFMWGGDYERALEIFRATGMIPVDMKVKPFIERYASVMSAAAYDFLGKRIIFPQTKPTRGVLLHELCHAMQDERHNIAKLMRTTGGSYDKILAMGALIEGEATNVQLRYSLRRSRLLAGLIPYGTMRRETRKRAEAMRQRWMRWLRDIPPNVIRTQGFVYDEGVLFVERLRRRKRNWAWVDAAYKMPPRSTSQILHPEKYIAGEWPVRLEIENKEKLLPGYRLVTENTLGEFGMRLFLQTHLPKLEAPGEVVEGWRGDRVYLYREKGGGKDVIAWVSTWESTRKADEVKSLLTKALHAHALKSGRYGKPLAMSAGALSVTGKRCDVAAFIATNGLWQRIAGASVRKTTTQGRPFGDKEEKTKER